MKSTPHIHAKNRPHSGKYAGKEAGARLAERRKKLLAAGIQLIGRHGFAAMTIDAVCAEAGLTKRYFYESFANREELLTEAYRVVTQEFLGSILQATTPYLNDSRKLVRAGLQQTFSFVADNPDKARLIMIEAMSVRSQLGHVYGKAYNEFVSLLVGFTKPFLPDEGPGDDILAVMARGAVGAIIHLCQGWIATDFRQPMEELVSGTEHIFGGMGRDLGIAAWVGKPQGRTKSRAIKRA
jgi:AcrR family transcriptional regulator